MLEFYKIDITNPFDLQKIVPNPTRNETPSLYDLANATIGTKLQKKKGNKKEKLSEEEELIFGWGNVPLSDEQVKYGALDARLGFEIARRHWKLRGYSSNVDRLNIIVDE